MKHYALNFLLLFVFCVFLSCSKKPSNGASSTPERPKVSSYFSVKPTTLNKTLVKRGIIRPANKVELRASRKIKVSKVHVANLSPVKKGDLIVEVDKSETLKKKADLIDKAKTLELEISTLETKFGFQRKNFERKRPLIEKGIITQKEFDEAEKEYKIAENDLKAKKLDWDKSQKEQLEIEEQLKISNFTAPIDGVVSGLVSLEKNPNPDVEEGQPVATVSDPNSLALFVQLEENYLPLVQLGAGASVEVDSAPNQPFAAKISSINPDNSPGYQKVRLFEVILVLETPDKVQDGFSGSAKLVDQKKDSVLTIPIAALQYMDGKPHANVASSEKGAPELKAVELGEKSETEIEVISGIKPGEFVVIDG